MMVSGNPFYFVGVKQLQTQESPSLSLTGKGDLNGVVKGRLKYKPISFIVWKTPMTSTASTASPNQNNESWVHRLITERVELDKKVGALRLFLGSKVMESLVPIEQAALREQLYHMESYSWILGTRIRRSNVQTNI